MNEQQRAGNTVTTSVSLSKEFSKLVNQYNLSPTECLRRGIAVTLYDLGVAMYNSPLNKDRSKFMHKFLEEINKEEETQKQFENMKTFLVIKKHLDAIEKIKKDIEDGVNGD